MTSPVGSSTSVPYTPPAPVAPQQIKSSSKDSDGDNDGSKPGEVESPKPVTGNVGTVVDTTA